MDLAIRGKVAEIRDTQWRGIKRIVVEHEGGESLLELPLDRLSPYVTLNVGDDIELSISLEKDENYRSNWDVYMWGVVYSYRDERIYISVGGLIMSVYVPKDGAPFSIGSKVYVGVKKR